MLGGIRLPGLPVLGCAHRPRALHLIGKSFLFSSDFIVFFLIFGGGECLELGGEHRIFPAGQDEVLPRERAMRRFSGGHFGLHLSVWSLLFPLTPVWFLRQLAAERAMVSWLSAAALRTRRKKVFLPPSARCQALGISTHHHPTLQGREVVGCYPTSGSISFA